MTDIAPQAPLQDWTLEQMVALANIGLNMRITLLVDGAVVSGQLIGGDQYFTLLAEKVSRADGDEVIASSMSKSFEGHAAEYEKLREADRQSAEDSEAEPVQVAFIHLKDTQVIVNNAQALTLDLWRGRLSKVAGWTLGGITG